MLLLPWGIPCLPKLLRTKRKLRLYSQDILISYPARQSRTNVLCLMTVRPPYDIPEEDPSDYAELRRFRVTLLKLFPESVKYADETFADRWSPGPANGLWFTCFAESTADGMRRRDDRIVSGHLTIVSATYVTADKHLKGFIDVNYMEDLFYDVDVESSRWGWQRVPQNLRDLYTTYWNSVAPRYVTRLEPDSTAG